MEIAIGSAYETETQILIASDLNFINEEDRESLCSNLEIIIKMLLRFKSTLLAV